MSVIGERVHSKATILGVLQKPKHSAFELEYEALRLRRRVRDASVSYAVANPDYPKPKLPQGRGQTPVSKELSRLLRLDWLSARDGALWNSGDGSALVHEYERVSRELRYARTS